MSGVNGLPKTERLHSLTAQRRLFQEGTSGFVYPFRYMVYKQQGASPSVEVLFSVPKRNHKRANKRNLLRRRMKEAYRLQKGALWEYATNQGLEFDVALVYSSKELLSYKSIENGIRKVLEELCCVR